MIRVKYYPHLAATEQGCTTWTSSSDEYFYLVYIFSDRLCGLVVKVPGYRSRGPDSIPGATTFSEK
jgi:hypothetical protein